MKIGGTDMDCEAVRENAEEYIKKEIFSDEIKAHLESCHECREYFSELGKLFSSYPNYEKDFEYPKDIEEKIKKSLKDIEKAEVL